MNLNWDKLQGRFRDIEESLQRLRLFRQRSVDDFLPDQDAQDIASFRLIVATEAAIDICLHIAAKFLRRAPEEYAGCFLLLGQGQIIDQNLAARLAKMARLRSLLVHRYWEIDYTRMHSIITGADLGDLEEFVRQISRRFRE